MLAPDLTREHYARNIYPEFEIVQHSCVTHPPSVFPNVYLLMLGHECLIAIWPTVFVTRQCSITLCFLKYCAFCYKEKFRYKETVQSALSRLPAWHRFGLS